MVSTDFTIRLDEVFQGPLDLLLHLAQRFEEVGLMKSSNKVRVPITQQHIADTLGLSLVHTNRTLGQLMRSRVIRWKEQQYDILNRDRLIELAGVDEPETAVRPLL